METHIEENKKKVLQGVLHPSEQYLENFAYDYTLFQANMQRFLPKLDIDNLEELYKQFMYHQCLVFYDQFDLKKLDTLSIINNSTFDLLPSHLKEPIIFATFHYGSFRVINSYLLTQGFKVVLILDEHAYNTQKEIIEKFYLKYKEEIQKNNSDFIILNVKDLSIIAQLQKLLLDGYVLVVYMDGNAGSLKERNFNKGWVEIDFLNSRIHVKNGIALLSLMLKASIIPIITCWDDKENLEMKFYQSISPNNYSDSKLYIKDSIWKLYAILEECLYTNPVQWECWTYIHKWFERNSQFPYEEIDRKKLKYEFNKKRYALFSLKGKYYFFDKFSYRGFSIDEVLYKILKSNNINKIEDTTLKYLINKNTII